MNRVFRPLELFIGLRYTRAKKRQRLISFISLVSIVGITLGIWALIVTLSVMNGFGNEVRGRILSFVSHVTITEHDGRLHNWEALAVKVKEHPRVIAHAPYILGQALVARGKGVNGVVVRGIDPATEKNVSEVADKIVLGDFASLKSGEFGVIVGQTLAWKLDLVPGSQVSLVVPQSQATLAGMLPRFKRFTVVGVFKADMGEYDAGLVMVHIDDAAKLYQHGNTVTGLRLKLNDVDAAPETAYELSTQLSHEYRTRDWTREHGVWFSALKMEKTIMFIILLLIVTVAMFNVVSTLVVVVNEKKADIAILRTMGLAPKSVLGIFMVQGSFIGVTGTLVGTVSGVLTAIFVPDIVAGIESVFGTKFLAPEIYFISRVPSDLQWADVAIISGVSLALSLLSTLYPAWRASVVQPAEALRYE
jgi:lipoprotein-releasing system permease protein